MKKLSIIIVIVMMGTIFSVGCSKKDKDAVNSNETQQEHSEHDGHNH